MMLSIINPKFLVPALGEGRHIMNHAKLAIEWGMPADAVFPLRNGQILQIDNGVADVIGSIEAASVLFNRDQGDRVTTYSVNERRNLSNDGIVSIGMVVDSSYKLVSGPTIEVSAAGFTLSPAWETCREKLVEVVKQTLEKLANPAERREMPMDIPALRAAVREVSSKTIRGSMRVKPTVQVIVQELSKLPLP